MDFKKAFDSIWHKVCSLNSVIITNGNFLDLIKNIYKHTNCAVKVNNKLTNFSKYNNGVRQGDPLSPTLFNIFMNDLFSELESVNISPVNLNEGENVSALMYADDLVMLSSTTVGLQNMLTKLDDYSKNWNI